MCPFKKSFKRHIKERIASTINNGIIRLNIWYTNKVDDIIADDLSHLFLGDNQ